MPRQINNLLNNKKTVLLSVTSADLQSIGALIDLSFILQKRLDGAIFCIFHKKGSTEWH